ncbi:Uncharacterised protein [Klebsiella quasipneumoniae]|uniref:hypothetical protein n=1 Tax=Klebsiella pneumoniae complex TaxID=3390273 RepID=UPI0009BA5B9C|nr:MULTISPECIES: hypothetical protein [Klebsiella]SLX36806.1 Uncharacterised protein [Klebsiella quasipneumoniae]SLX43963.1 Uncharacterised protein [Klebsiella quasipneumoniae]SLX44121.1 Uncharacterised protein [Klebsiella quasipneumoniae]SLX49539.1 Uncharacterised protein [Klebsiella quasipneumoniae]SLX59349.1 Uncharacterised protein [Klebsiella quasipneumoniae]
MINRNKLEHILEYAKQQRYIGQSCKVPPEDMVEIMERLLSACNSPAIPDGYVMVPIEPTMSQELAGYKTLNDTGRMSRLMKTRLSNIYRAMLAAAQQEVK